MAAAMRLPTRFRIDLTSQRQRACARPNMGNAHLVGQRLERSKGSQGYGATLGRDWPHTRYHRGPLARQRSRAEVHQIPRVGGRKRGVPSEARLDTSIRSAAAARSRPRRHPYGWALATSALDFDDLSICLAATGDVVAAEDFSIRDGGAPLEGLCSEHLDHDGDPLARSGAANLIKAEALSRA